MRISIIIISIIFILNLSATIINIPADQPTIQSGINASVAGDTILVQPGTYFENINYNGKNITIASLYLTTQDSTYISQTIIDGGNNYSVVKFENLENTNALLYGFKIINGSTGISGGGILIDGASPTINHCMINENRSKGIKINDNSAPNIYNCIISQNYGNGIVCVSNLNSHIKNAIISDNGFGSGIVCIWSNPVIENTIINDNYAIDCGAGIFMEQSSPTLINVVINNNIALTEEPSATSWGAGICMQSNCNPIITNSLITENRSYGPGAAISALGECNVTLINSTITSNHAQASSITISWSNISIVNSVLWNNDPIELSLSNSILSMNYSNIQGGENGINIHGSSTINWLNGNISNDPLFLETGDYPYQLTEFSPCIDTGIPDTTSLHLPPFDLIGNIRIWDGDNNGSTIIDMGAYEFGAPPLVKIDNNIVTQASHNILQQNYPNPFNPSTTIEFSIQNNSDIELSIYNIKGQKIKTLLNNDFYSGKHSIIWNGEDENSKPVSSGIYYYKLNVNGKIKAVKKCLLLK